MESDKLEKKRAYNREYQRTHREQNNLARKKWAKNHPEEARKLNTDSHRRWRESNRGKYNAYQREYQAKRRAEIDNKNKFDIM